MIYFVSYESEFCSELRNTEKWENGVCLENATIIQDMFEIGKPDIALKKVKVFNIKRIFFLNFDFRKKVFN